MADINPAGRRAIDVEIIDEAGPVEADPAVDLVAEDETGGGLPRGAVRLADGSVRLPLRYPVKMVYKTSADAPTKTEEYNELTFHRLLGADMRAISDADAGSKAVMAIARSTRLGFGLMSRLFDRMDAADTVAAGVVIGHFLGNGLKTGR
nr:phage tail assembly protein [uncultured Rhodopila sp.]